MNSAADLERDENFRGGFYELAVLLGPRDDDRLRAALAVVLRTAGVSGPRVKRSAGSAEVAPGLDDVLFGRHVYGTVVLPGGGETVCGALAVRIEDGDEDWLDFYLPLGALATLDPRIGAFPFGPEGGAVSRAWREPLDTWLTGIAVDLYAQLPFRHAVVGFEVSGDDPEPAGDVDRFVASVVPDPVGGIEVRPVTRWDFGRPG